MHYEERGAGRPLLLVPGIPAIASDWAPLAEPLSRSRRVIAYDNRGSGATTVTPPPYTTAGLAADAVALLDALEIERADVFGMSLGGMIAQELALGWPERVDRLVLGCTHCGLAHAEAPEREAGRAFAMETDDWSERMTALAGFAFAPGVEGQFLDRFVEKKSADVQEPEGYQGQIAAVLAHDSYDRLPGLARPTLIVTATAIASSPAPAAIRCTSASPARDWRWWPAPGTCSSWSGRRRACGCSRSSCRPRAPPRPGPPLRARDPSPARARRARGRGSRCGRSRAARRCSRTRREPRRAPPCRRSAGRCA
jgi:3-oxoadipate enol-lactonase